MELENTVAVVLTQVDVEITDILIERIISMSPKYLIVVINNPSPAGKYQSENVFFINTGKNLGAAGGFSLGISEALRLRPEFIWTCDDDAIPDSKDLLKDLGIQACIYTADITAPIIVSSENPDRLAFPYRRYGKRLWKCSDIIKFDFLLGQAHLFNGTLFRASIFADTGLPDARLFIRGDEREFLLRVKRKGFKILTIPNLRISHPTGENELHHTFFKLLRVPIPQSNVKYSYYVRNRGYLVRKFHRVDWLLIDLIRYFSFFILSGRFPFSIFQETLWLYFKGFLGAVDEELLMDDATYLRLIAETSAGGSSSYL